MSTWSNRNAVALFFFLFYFCSDIFASLGLKSFILQKRRKQTGGRTLSLFRRPQSHQTRIIWHLMWRLQNPPYYYYYYYYPAFKKGGGDLRDVRQQRHHPSTTIPTPPFFLRPRGSGPTVERRGIRAPLSIISSAAAGALATTRTDNSVEASRRPPPALLQPPAPSTPRPHPPQLPKPASPEARRPSLGAFISADDAHKNGAPAWIIGSSSHRLIGCCSKTPH